MKTRSSALVSAQAGAVQRPAFLVEMAFGTVRRWTSMATLSWNGQTWSATDLRVEGLKVLPFQVQGTLVLGNADGAAGALVLAEGVQDRAIRIWSYDAAATASGDVLWLCDAVGASASVTARDVRVTLRHRCEFTGAPRTYVTPSAGFNTLLPAGTVLRINGIDMRLERRS